MVAATAEQELAELEGLLHDAHGDQDLILFDETLGRLEFPVAQEIDTWMDVPEKFPRTRGRKRSRLWGTTLRVPFLQINVVVWSVRRFELGPEERVADPWMLNEVEFDPSSRRLTFEPAVGPDLRVDVDELRVEAEITPHVALVVRRRIWPIVGAESDSPEWDNLSFRAPRKDAD